MENSLFSKDVYSPSIFLGPHPLPSQVFRFALASSSLAILSARSSSTIKLKYEKIEGCGQFNLPLVFFYTDQTLKVSD